MDFSGSERVPQPAFETTGDPLHLALAFGADDFCLERPRAQADFFILVAREGGYRYTRYGAFQIDPAGDLRHASGLLLSPSITVPPGGGEIQVAFDGVVRLQRGPGGSSEEIGVLLVARFPKVEALKAVGAGLFEAPPEAGEPVIGRPATLGAGRLHQGMIDRAEASRETPPSL